MHTVLDSSHYNMNRIRENSVKRMATSMRINPQNPHQKQSMTVYMCDPKVCTCEPAGVHV